MLCKVLQYFRHSAVHVRVRQEKPKSLIAVRDQLNGFSEFVIPGELLLERSLDLHLLGVQVSKALPILEIAGDLTTDGGEGQSLVKGVQISLKAIALSGKVGSVKIGGRVGTTGHNVVSVEVEDGKIEIAGGIVAEGKNSDGVHVRGYIKGLDGISDRAVHGQEIVRIGWG